MKLFRVYRGGMWLFYKVIVKLFFLAPDFPHGDPIPKNYILLHRRSSVRYSTTGYSRWYSIGHAENTL